MRHMVQFRDRFSRDERGATAVMFGLIAMALIVLVLGGLDVSRAMNERSRLQDALDAATLLAARGSDDDPASVDAIGKKAMSSQLLGNEGFAATVKASFSNTDADTVKGTASATFDPIILGLFARDTLVVNVTTSVKRGQNNPVELVLVLDTTGSMAGAKLAGLKTAAKTLVDTMTSDANAKVKLGVVPFGQYVNTGVSRRNQPWMNVPADYSDGRYGASHTYTGCTGSPSYPANVTDNNTGRRYPGFLDTTCGAELTPLTANATTVKAGINALNATGVTYIPSGLAWGFNLLSQPQPFTEAAAYDSSGQNVKPHKALVLMTDGENTILMDADTGKHDVTPRGVATQANKYTAELCDNIKAQKIEVFTVAFQVTDGTAKSMLRKCASDDAHYYDAANVAGLNDAFAAIARSMRALYISH